MQEVNKILKKYVLSPSWSTTCRLYRTIAASTTCLITRVLKYSTSLTLKRSIACWAVSISHDRTYKISSKIMDHLCFNSRTTKNLRTVHSPLLRPTLFYRVIFQFTMHIKRVFHWYERGKEEKERDIYRERLVEMKQKLKRY